MKLTRRQLAQTLTLGMGVGLAHVASPNLPAPKSSSSSSALPVAPESIPDITKQVCEFVLETRYADVPAEVIELGKKSILDGLGLALSGSVAKTGEITRTYLQSLGLSRREATVIGSSLEVPVQFAAFANGIQIHADDYDDTQLAVANDRVYGLLTHPTAPVLPVAFSIAEAGARSGRDLMLAYQIGVEVECKIAEAIAPRHYEDGFHSTGTIGVFGSAAAACKLRHLDLPQMANAFGIAGAQSSGLRENFGTMTKPFQAGHAAQAGIIAVDFAALGWTASDKILEAPRGFFQAAGGGYSISAISHKLGHPWTFASPGVSIKPFPSGSLTHPGMTEMLRLIKENRISADQVEAVDVGTNRNMPNALIHHHPKNALQAKFSMEFCLAILLLFGKAGLHEFTDEVVTRPDVQEMMKRIHFGISPIAEQAGYNKMTTIIDIHLKDGRTISGRADFGKGSPADPMSYEQVAAKFEDCAAFAKWSSAKAKSIIAMVASLENLQDARALALLCAKS
jgi:2-methylcitrate dehydratase PrpD